MSYALALDMIETVKRTPASSLLWQRLSVLIRALEGSEKTALLQLLATVPLESPEAQWLRCSALASLTQDPVWFARQAALTDDTFTADAIMTLLELAWGTALIRRSEHDAFAQFLRDIDTPRLQRLVVANMSGPVPMHRAVPGARLRVAIYTTDAANNLHGGTAITLNTMSVLKDQGLDLHGFVARESSIPSIDSYHGGTQSIQPLLVHAETLKLSTPGTVQLFIADAAFSLRFRFDQLLRAIDAYAPDVVIFVGFMSPLVYRLYAHYPVVCLSVHALPPVVPADVWLSAEPQADAACWPGVPVPQVFPFSFRFWPKGKAQPVERAAVGLPADTTLLVTVGSRLDIEITPPWSTQMLSFLETHPDVHWILVGVSENKSPPSVPLHPRIHLITQQTRLETWFAMCDIYVNPHRIGGGGSLAMAMEQGLAVVTFSNSDGGDKVGGFAVDSSEDYFAQLSAWVRDPEARRQTGNELKARFHSRLDFSNEAAASGLLQACQRAIESFNQRNETARA